jgi:hypothetical protein
MKNPSNRAVASWPTVRALRAASIKVPKGRREAFVAQQAVKLGISRRSVQRVLAGDTWKTPETKRRRS